MDSQYDKNKWISKQNPYKLLHQDSKPTQTPQNGTSDKPNEFTDIISTNKHSTTFLNTTTNNETQSNETQVSMKTKFPPNQSSTKFNPSDGPLSVNKFTTNNEQTDINKRNETLHLKENRVIKGN